MLAIKARGLARYVGVANHTIAHLRGLRGVDVLQVEFNPTTFQAELLAYCRKLGICFMGYGSLAGSIYGREIRGIRSSSRVLDHPVVREIAAALACDPAQVCIKWGLQHGAVCIPKTSSPARLCANANANAGAGNVNRDSRGCQSLFLVHQVVLVVSNLVLPSISRKPWGFFTSLTIL